MHLQPQTLAHLFLLRFLLKVDSKHVLKINCLSDHEGDPESIPKKYLLGQECSRDRVGASKVIPEQETLDTAEMQPTTFEHAELERTRKDLVDARVQFEDDRWLQKQRDSDLRAWCKPVTRDVQLDAIQSF
jgi:hypothetical protein